MAVAILVGLSSLTACGEATRGTVLEKHDASDGIPQSVGCKSTEWLLVIDQGDRNKKIGRFVKKCVSYTVATKYKIGSNYP